MIAPRPSSTDSTPKPGFPMSPFFGINPVLIDNNVRKILLLLLLLLSSYYYYACRVKK